MYSMKKGVSMTPALDLPPPFQRLRHRDLVGVFEVATDREAKGEAGCFDAEGTNLLGDVGGCRFALDVRIRRDDDFADRSRLQPFDETSDVDVLRSDTFQRRE